MMSYEKIFDASYERVVKAKNTEVDFFHRFYEHFTQSSQEIALMFANTDMEKQRAMLKKSFYSLLVFYATGSVDHTLAGIAQSHSNKGLNIRPGLYDQWLECLILTLKECDKDFDDEVELAWRLVMAGGITYMKFKSFKDSAV
jgi:hemoglobin-like flavoprotein